MAKLLLSWNAVSPKIWPFQAMFILSNFDVSSCSLKGARIIYTEVMLMTSPHCTGG